MISIGRNLDTHMAMHQMFLHCFAPCSAPTTIIEISHLNCYSRPSGIREPSTAPRPTQSLCYQNCLHIQKFKIGQVFSTYLRALPKVIQVVALSKLMQDSQPAPIGDYSVQ